MNRAMRVQVQVMIATAIVGTMAVRNLVERTRRRVTDMETVMGTITLMEMEMGTENGK